MKTDLTPGSAIYSPGALRLYDLFVLGVSNQLLWRCPTRGILALYDRHVSERHMDIGVGTGYFLDHCRFPSPKPEIALVDLNPNTLEFTAERIRRYNPACYRVNVLDPVKLDVPPFRSIGMNYLLHCLPGDMASKAAVFRNLRPMLAEGGVVFGTTLLGVGVPRNLLARRAMAFYNARGIFGNERDTLEGLEAALAANFSRHTVTVRGCAALFTAHA